MSGTRRIIQGRQERAELSRRRKICRSEIGKQTHDMRTGRAQKSGRPKRDQKPSKKGQSSTGENPTRSAL